MARVGRWIVLPDLARTVPPSPRRGRCRSAADTHHPAHRIGQRSAVTERLYADREALVRCAPVIRASAAPVLDVVSYAAADPISVRAHRTAVGREAMGRRCSSGAKTGANLCGPLREHRVEFRVVGIRPQRRAMRGAGGEDCGRDDGQTDPAMDVDAPVFHESSRSAGARSRRLSRDGAQQVENDGRAHGAHLLWRPARSKTARRARDTGRQERTCFDTVSILIPTVCQSASPAPNRPGPRGEASSTPPGACSRDAATMRQLSTRWPRKPGSRRGRSSPASTARPTSFSRSSRNGSKAASPRCRRPRLPSAVRSIWPPR